MSSFILKIIAIVTMFIDHIGYAIFGRFTLLNYIGRISFPIFAFQISEGYVHTKNLKKYFLRLLLFALVSQIPFMLFHSIISSNFYLNIFFTLFLGLFSIYIYDKFKYKFLGILAGIFLAFIAHFFRCDYGAYGVSIILIFYIFKNNIITSSLFFILATFIRYFAPCIRFGFFSKEYLYLFICTTLSCLFFASYNGRKGKNTKYLLYLFYPIHLLLIYGLYLILN